MPVIETQQNFTSGGGIDAATLLAYVQDPKAYAAKLAELEGARKAAKEAVVENLAAVEKLVKAEEIDALLIQTRAESEASKNALAKAREEAANIVALAQAQAKNITDAASEKVELIKKALEEEGLRADAISAELEKRAKAIEAEVAGAKTAQAAANELAAISKKATTEAETANAAATAKLSFITTSFNDFVDAVKG